MAVKYLAELDPGFAPLSIELRDFAAQVEKAGGEDLLIAIERDQGFVARYDMRVLPDGVDDEKNFHLAERVVKSLLWMRGGYKITLCGPKALCEKLKAAYAVNGLREFDRAFMSGIYESPFEVIIVDCPCKMPAAREGASAIGRHLDGCRIGFDAGGSDRKVSAVIDGETVYSEEVLWFPKENSNPQYQYDGILEAMKTAASHMPRVDAIGVSSAGVYINNKIRAASLFIKVSPEDFDKYVKNMYIDVAREIGPDIPLEVANDGDVTALAGAMDLNENAVMGIAMGTSEAGGYVDKNGNITGWLNELAFVPVDANPSAMVDEWSGDYGCGVKYFSQDAVIKLAPAAGIELDATQPLAHRLKAVQKLMEDGDPRARKIYETFKTETINLVNLLEYAERRFNDETPLATKENIYSNISYFSERMTKAVSFKIETGYENALAALGGVTNKSVGWKGEYRLSDSAIEYWNKKKAKYNEKEEAVKQERVKREQEEKERKRAEYWEQHAEEKAKLDEEKKSLQEQIAQLNQEIADIPGGTEKEEIQGRISSLLQEKEALGLFKLKEKKEVQGKIDAAQAELKAVTDRMDAAEQAIKEKISPLQKRINEIDTELTKDR